VNLTGTILLSNLLYLFSTATLFIGLLVVIILVQIYLIKWLTNRNLKLLIQKNHELESINQKLLLSENRLKKMNMSKDRLFSIISHDLRNPMNALLGLAEILNKNIAKLSGERIIKYSGIIYTSAHSIYSQIESLLEWSRAQSNNIQYKPELFDLRPLILNVFTLFELAAFNKKIDLLCQIDNANMVYADRETIALVLRNLIDNGIKFTKEGGKVIVTSKKIDNFVEVSVTDTGIGISNDDLSKLFRFDEVFTRSGTRGEQGTGLGLIMCKEFIEINKGKINVTSHNQSGSTFYFSIPAKAN
jgi:signal transduction histidine kinase